MDSNSDSALMLQVKAGDLDKLGLLFERYNRKLYNYFYRLTYRRDVSEDLVQSVFERIIKYRHTYSDEGAFSTWIYQIARNLRIDHHHKTNKEADDNHIDFEQLEDSNDDSESVGDLELTLLKKAIERLDPEKKETLILSRYQGFKYKEIAEILDCSESAVKVRIFRAMNELKETITELRKHTDYD